MDSIQRIIILNLSIRLIWCNIYLCKKQNNDNNVDVNNNDNDSCYTNKIWYKMMYSNGKLQILPLPIRTTIDFYGEGDGKRKIAYELD